MDFLVLIDQLDDLVYSAKPLPFTDQVRVDRQQAYEILDQMRITMPEEIKQARWIVKERREMVEAQRASPELNEIANSLEELKRAQPAKPPPLTAAAAEQVRGIVEAAETSAVDVRKQAGEEARRTAEEAERARLETRRHTAAEAASRLLRVEEATREIAKDADTISSELNELLERMRGPAGSLIEIITGGADSLGSELEALRKRLSDVDASGPDVDASGPEVDASGPEVEGADPEETRDADRGGTAPDDWAPTEFDPRWDTRASLSAERLSPPRPPEESDAHARPRESR